MMKNCRFPGMIRQAIFCEGDNYQFYFTYSGVDFLSTVKVK